MHKLTLLAAIGAVTLSGCDFTAPAPATPAAISAIEVSGLTGSGGDPDGQPDVFLEVRSASGRAYFRSATVVDANVSETLSFDVSDVMVSSPTMPLYVTVFAFNQDLISSRTMATSVPFSVEDLSAEALDLAAGNARVVVRSGATIDTGGDE